MTTYPLEERCPAEGCQGSLVAIPGPHGKTRSLFARVECSVCSKWVRWSQWPQKPDHLLILDGAARCRSCGHPVLWSETAKGKAIPLHLDGPPRTVIDTEGEAHTGWEAHHAHCPHADKHRKGGT